MWQKKISTCLIIVLVVIGLATAALFAPQEEKDCCLCGSFRYHAPCLVDLETGHIVELQLYAPHPNLGGELAEHQPDQGSFSFLRIGNASGYRDTAAHNAAVEVPVADKTGSPALCTACRQQLPLFYRGRYALADLYNKDGRKLFPINGQLNTSMRCYQICVDKNEESTKLRITIQGTLEE